MSKIAKGIYLTININFFKIGQKIITENLLKISLVFRGKMTYFLHASVVFAYYY